MRYILLMRHAKSSWDNRSQSDHARPLNLQGQNASEAMAKTLHAKGFAPDEIWASDSARTTETAKIIMRVLPGPQTVKYNPKLYHASGQKIIEQINAFPPPEGNLMVLAHNPGMEQLFNDFTGRYISFPTAACAVFKVKKETEVWFKRDSLSFIDFIKPKDLDI